jgi:hypothetical protein
LITRAMMAAWLVVMLYKLQMAASYG